MKVTPGFVIDSILTRSFLGFMVKLAGIYSIIAVLLWGIGYYSSIAWDTLGRIFMSITLTAIFSLFILLLLALIFRLTVKLTDSGSDEMEERLSEAVRGQFGFSLATLVAWMFLVYLVPELIEIFLPLHLAVLVLFAFPAGIVQVFFFREVMAEFREESSERTSGLNHCHARA